MSPVVRMTAKSRLAHNSCRYEVGKEIHPDQL